MLKLGDELSQKRKRLLARERTWNRKRKLSHAILAASFLITMFLLFLTLYESLYSLLSGTAPFNLQEFLTTEIIGLSYLSYIPFLIGFIVALYLEKRQAPYELAPEEKLFLKVCSTIDNLQAYIEEKKEIDRKSVEDNLNEIHTTIEDWEIGELRIIEAILGSKIKAFSVSFFKRIIGAIRKGTPEDLYSIFGILKSFAKYLINPNPEIGDLDFLINAMNTSISVEIPSEVKKKSLRSYLGKPSLGRHLLVVTLTFVIAWIVGFFGILLGAPVWTGYGFSIVVIIGLLAPYSTITSRERQSQKTVESSEVEESSTENQ